MVPPGKAKRLRISFIHGPFNLALLVAGAMHVQEYLMENSGKEKRFWGTPRWKPAFSLLKDLLPRCIFIWEREHDTAKSKTREKSLGVLLQN